MSEQGYFPAAVDPTKEYERLNAKAPMVLVNFLIWLLMALGHGQKTIHDLGCGGGRLSILIAKALGSVGIIGVDKNTTGLQMAHKLALDADIPFEAMCGSITQRIFEDEAIDVGICNFVAEYLSPEERRSAWQTLFMALHPKGVLTVTDISQHLRLVPGIQMFSELDLLLQKGLRGLKDRWDPEVGLVLKTELEGAGFHCQEITITYYTSKEDLMHKVEILAQVLAQKSPTDAARFRELAIAHITEKNAHTRANLHILVCRKYPPAP